MRVERVRRRVASGEGRAGGFEEVAKQCHQGDESLVDAGHSPAVV